MKPPAATVEEIVSRIKRHAWEVHHVDAEVNDGFLETCYTCQGLQWDLDALLVPELSQGFLDRAARGAL